MRASFLPIQALAENVKSLVAEENLRLTSVWRSRLRSLAQGYGPWTAYALSGAYGPRIKLLRVEIPCFERLPFRALFGGKTAPVPLLHLRLGTPGPLLKWLNLYHAHVLCIEVSHNNENTSFRVFLAEQTAPAPFENTIKEEEHD